MVVLLVAIMFIAFIAVDASLERRHRKLLAAEGEALHEGIKDTPPLWVAGFELPPMLRFHQGHAWVHQVGPDTAYVGLDDFARRLLGREVKVAAPPVGAYVRQGQAAVAVRRDGQQARLLAPISGEVVAVNKRLKGQPDLLSEDGYGRGWLFKIRSAHLFEELPNLLAGSLARRWTEDVRERFQHRLMLATGSVFQDGGVLASDLAEHLGKQEWKSLVDEFLLQDADRQ
jgi:glycine cleavage system H protein